MDQLNPRPQRVQQPRKPKKLRAQAKPSVTMEPPNTSAVTEASADNAVAQSEVPIQQTNRLQVRIGHINALPKAKDTVMYQADLTPTDLVPTKSDNPNSPFIMQTRNFQQFRLGGAHIHVQPLFPMSTGAQLSLFYLPPGANMPTDLSVTSLACLQFCVTRSGDRPINLTIPGSVLNTLNDGWCPTVPNESGTTPGRLVLVQHSPAMNPFTQTSGTLPLPYDQAYVALTASLLVCMRGQAAQNMVVTQMAGEKDKIQFTEEGGVMAVSLATATKLSAARRQRFYRAGGNGFGSALIQVAQIALDTAGAVMPPPFNWLTNAGGWFLRKITSNGVGDKYAVFLNRRDAMAGQPVSAPAGTNAQTSVVVTLRMVEDTGGLPPGLDVIPTRTAEIQPTPPVDNLLTYEDELVATRSGNVGLLWNPGQKMVDVYIKQVRGDWAGFLRPDGLTETATVRLSLIWGEHGQFGFDDYVTAGFCEIEGEGQSGQLKCPALWFIRSHRLYVISPTTSNSLMVSKFQPARGVDVMPDITTDTDLLVFSGSEIGETLAAHITPVMMRAHNGLYIQNNVAATKAWTTPLYYGDMYHHTVQTTTMVNLTTTTSITARYTSTTYSGFTTYRTMCRVSGASTTDFLSSWIGPGPERSIDFTPRPTQVNAPPAPTLGSEQVQLDLLARLADLLMRNLGLSLDQEHALAMVMSEVAEESGGLLLNLPPVDRRGFQRVTARRVNIEELDDDPRPRYWV
uniref:Capsid protein n=1 Tax=Wenling fish hepevirus TaxID=2116397 RepID=A0A2P1GMS0_9VIRU|nr:capsid protein [Wenling fish hepevirus]